MVREPRGLPAAVLGGAKERHMRHTRSQLDPSAPVPPGLVAKLAVPKSKHHTYFEFVENKNKKKKKLELEVTTKKEPPPGFAYVPIGNPDLTTACKEISRERDAMIFIVSTSKAGASNQISGQVHRIGHHIRESIVEEAKASLALLPRSPVTCPNGEHEPIPESQQEYLAQADAALRDLFPRIPNTDRQAIINHSFTRGLPTKGELPVGLCQDISLARRVQLAVLAHIRHVHTRYDQLLKETTWQNARKVVEQLCLDTLVQWRGDEETGRDQLDEILREVVVISDSEPGDSEYESTDETWTEERDLDPDASCLSSVLVTRPEPTTTTTTTAGIDTPMAMQSLGSPPLLYEDTPLSQRRPRSQRRNQRGFKRYRAWEEALRRNRDREHSDYPIAMDTGSASYSTYPPHQAPIHSQAPVRATAFGVPATPRPLTPPSQDIPIPSIESFSPPSMPPAFVRSVPSRLPPPEALYPPCWDNQSQYQVNIPSRNAGMMITGENVQFPPARLPQPPMMHSQYAPIRSRQVTHVAHSEPSMPNPTEPWPPYGSIVARRITMDVNRPGERSNPIIMEDRGGFFERVSQPEEHGVAAALEAPVLVREVRRWSRPLEQPYSSPRSYAAAAHGDCPLTTQDQNRSGVEAYSATREAPNMISMSVSQPVSHDEHLSGYPSPRRDVQQQNGRGLRDGQFVHGRNRGYGARSPGHSSPRRWRGNIIVLE